MSISSYPTWLEVNLSAIEFNTRLILKTSNVPLMTVVKANAYGLGAIEVSRASLAAGATWLAVARVGEALELRQAGITAPILVLGMALPEEVDQAIASDITLNLFSKEAADLYSQRAKAVGKPVKVHMKVDTGMGRLGVLWPDAVSFAKYAKGLGGIDVEGLFSHFTVSDVVNHPFTTTQNERFQQVVDSLHAEGLLPKWVHLANSAATLCVPDSRYTLARSGTSLVGINYRPSQPFPDPLRRVVSWKAKLAMSKILPPDYGIGYGLTYTTVTDEFIGTVPVGYGDGFRRMVGNHVLIEGRKLPIVARICMDQLMVRMPKLYPMGTEVVFIGEQGNAHIYIEELADLWRTSEVDVITGINRRVPRVYTRD